MNETWWVSKDQLIGEQLGVIDLPLEGSYLILGPPGSGKTNLLLLRANYLYLAGNHDISLIVFTRTLQEFLAAGAAQYDFPSHKIVTSTKWFSDLLRSFGRDVPKGDFKQVRVDLLSEAQDLIKEKKLSKIQEVILLDEAQDYWPEEIKVFETLSERLFVVGDSGQKIYKGGDTISLVDSLVDETRKLKHHFRNGRKICRLADLIAKGAVGYSPMEATSHYDEVARPSSVDSYNRPSLDAQLAEVLSKLDLQRKTYPDELLGICCPLRDDVEAVWAALQNTEFGEVAIVQKADSHCEFASDSRICVSTIHAAKGLEFRALHLVGLEALRKFSFDRNVAFTAVTRAKTSLSLYYSSRIPTFLGSAIQKLQPPPPLPSVGAAFGKSK